MDVFSTHYTVSGSVVFGNPVQVLPDWQQDALLYCADLEPFSSIYPAGFQLIHMTYRSTSQHPRTRFVAHVPKCDYDHTPMTGAVKWLSEWVAEAEGVLAVVGLWPLTFSGWQTKGRCVWGASLPSASSPRYKTAPTGEWSRTHGKVKRSAAFSQCGRPQEIR